MNARKPHHIWIAVIYLFKYYLFKYIPCPCDWFVNKLRRTQEVYWAFRLKKCVIQFPRVFLVAGASLRHMVGNWPLNKDLARSSSSFDMPTSPLRARFSVESDLNIVDINLLNRSSSCIKTTVVGDTSRPYFFLILSKSYLPGIRFRISLAVASINSSLLMPPPISPG